MKLFKKLAGICLALTFCFGMVGLVACGGKGDNARKATGYTFLVLEADGDAAVGYYIQLCTTDGNAQCYPPSESVTDANGCITITTGGSCPAAAVYEVHVLTSDYQPVELSSTVHTPATFSNDVITVTLAA